MEQNATDLIIMELRELRGAFTENARASGERLAKLETMMYGIVGNGQPGRIGKLEESVEKLLQWRWYLIGVAAGVSAVTACVGWMIESYAGYVPK